MTVEWEEFYEPHHAEDYEDWIPSPPTRYRGEVINAVRSWGDTKLVVMLDSGTVREVLAKNVRRASPR